MPCCASPCVWMWCHAWPSAGRAAIGDSFPATALFPSSTQRSKRGRPARRTGKGMARKEKVCEREDSQSADKHATLDYTPLWAPHFIMPLNFFFHYPQWFCRSLLPALCLPCWLSCNCFWSFQPLPSACIRPCACLSDWLWICLCYYLADTHNPDTGHLTRFDSSTPRYSMPLICLPPPSSPLCYSHASAPTHPLRPALPSIPCDHRYPSRFPRLHTPIHTHTYTPRQKDLETHSFTVPWSRNERTKKQTHLPTFVLMHLLINANTLVMWCAVCHGVQMSGISVLALATLSTTGGLYRRKNQQSHSHEAAVSITNTGTGIRTRPCAHMRPGTFRGKLATHKKQRRGTKKKKKPKQKGSLTHTKWQKLTKNILVLTRKDKSTAGPCSE